MARIVCVVRNTPAAGVSFTWHDGPDEFPPYELDRQLVADFLAKYADEAREKLRALVHAYLAALPDEDQAAAVRAEFGLALAQAGAKLRQRVFRPAKEHKKTADQVGEWLKKLHARGEVESLEVVTEGGPGVPWNLLYDAEPDAAAFRSDPVAAWGPFWGLKYNLAAGQRVDPRRRMPWWDAPKILLVVDPVVRSGLPDEYREKLAAFERERGLVPVESATALRERLAECRPDLLYWLGHATPEALVLGAEDRQGVTPADLREMLEGDGDAPPGGLVFLNACQTAQSAASGSSFLDTVFKAGMGGVIATEQQTVDTFAVPFGLDFLTAVLVKGEPVGRALQALRARVPLGLLYGTYCPPEIRVAPAAVPAADRAVDVGVPLVGVALGSAPASPEYPLPAHPYRSLRAYGVGDRALFAGRDGDVVRFAQVLGDAGTRVVLLHGESGVGKTSFLRAGVIPYLEDECVGYRFARGRASRDGDPLLFVRATNDPESQLAAALGAYSAAPLVFTTPRKKEASADLPGVLREALGGRAGPDALRDALRTDPSFLGRLLSGVAAMLPFTPVLVIDQAEEVFTLARTPADEENRAKLLEMLRRVAGQACGFKVVVSLRTEYHGRFVDRLRRGTAAGVREYLLTDFGLDDLVEVIERPTKRVRIRFAAEVPFEKYGFRYADGVAEDIARRARAFTTHRQDSVLPLVQVICTQLHAVAQSRPDRVVTAADVAAIGGVEGGMKRHAEEMVRELFPSRADQKAFRLLLTDDATQLFLRQPDGTLTTALLPADYLARHWRGRLPFAEVLKTAGDGDRRLLRVNSLRIGGDDAERAYVSLGHDALAGVAADWKHEAERWRRVRKLAASVVGAVALAVLMAGLSIWALGEREGARKAEETAKSHAYTAGQERDRANVTRDAAERAAYISTLELADVQWELKNYPASIGLLEKYLTAKVASPTQSRDYPAFEWHYQWRRTKLEGPPIRGHTARVNVVAWSPDETRLATAAWDGTIRFWAWVRASNRWQEFGELSGQQSETSSLAWSPDGRLVATGGSNGAVRVWTRHPSGEWRPVPNPANQAVENLGPVFVSWCSSPVEAEGGEGFLLAAGGADGRTRLWEWSPRYERWAGPVVLAGSAEPVAATAWCPSGRRLAALTADGAVRVWERARPSGGWADPSTLTGQLGSATDLSWWSSPRIVDSL